MRAGWSLEESVAERRKSLACCLAKMAKIAQLSPALHHKYVMLFV